MPKIVLLLGGVVIAGIVVFLGWTLVSRRRALPCPAWLRWFVEIENPFFSVVRSKEIIEHLGLQPGMRVLDVGCGPGRVTIPLAKNVGPQGQVAAIDMQPKMLQRAEEKARQDKLSNITFQQVKMGEGKFDFHQFDRAIMVCVLGEIPAREKALQELFQALKPGGILSVTEVIADPHFQGQNAVRKLASSTGFRETTVFGNRFAFSMFLQKPEVS